VIQLKGHIRVPRLTGKVNLIPSASGGSGGPLQAKTAYPSHSEQIIAPDDDYYGLVSVTVKPVPRLPACVTEIFAQILHPVPIINGDFETGDLTGWKCTAATGFGVNTDDAYAGSYKFYFWSTTGKLYQTLTGLEPGTYRVNARIKQNTGTPTKSNFYANDNSVSVIGNSSYSKKSLTVEVTDGVLEFGIDFSGTSANTQVDSVEVFKVVES
jgi:hypothetical protein